jgi:membrane-associated phospholipid phosphatase
VTSLGELEKSVVHVVAAALARTAVAVATLGAAIAGDIEKSVAHALAAALRRTGLNVRTVISILGRAPRRPDGWRIILPAPVPLALGAAAALLAVGAAMVFLDAEAIRQTRRLPGIVVDIFNQITDFGTSGWFLWPTGLMVLLIAAVAAPALGRIANLTLIAVMVRVEFIFFAVAVPGLFFTILKRLIGRARPSELGPFHYVPFSWRSDYASLPSGHSTTAFSAAIAIGTLFPRARPALWIYAVTIALSRVVIAAHFPSDVIAGALVGGFGAVLVRNYFAVRGLVFGIGPDGRIRPWPGPSWRRIKRVAARIAAH